MLTQFKDYLKTLNLADHYYIGKIDNSKEKTIGIYSMLHAERIEAIGKQSSYDIAGFRILVHWNKSMSETETASRKVYSAIRYIQDTQMTDKFVYYVDLSLGEPQFIGTDENGVYEYHIMGWIYYKREDLNG